MVYQRPAPIDIGAELGKSLGATLLGGGSSSNMTVGERTLLRKQQIQNQKYQARAQHLQRMPYYQSPEEINQESKMSPEQMAAHEAQWLQELGQQSMEADAAATPEEQGLLYEKRLKEGGPIFQQNKARAKAVEDSARSIRTLKRLSDDPGFGKGRDMLATILENPENPNSWTNTLKTPAAAEWGKTIAGFINNAKGAFGSRVTNFDLQSFLKQYPSIMHTKEGRDRILRNMDLANQMNKAYEDTLSQVIKTHGGIKGISMYEAEQIAADLTERKVARILQEYEKNVGELEEGVSAPPKGSIVMISPDGEEAFVQNESEAAVAMKNGWKKK